MATTLTPPDKILDNIEDDFLSCPICLEQYKSPKTLPCLHTFCEHCLVTLVKKKKGVLTCPTCSKPCPLPNGVSGLKASFFINSLMGMLERRPSEVSKHTICEGCDENTASHRCVDCRLDFCSSCTKPHNRVSATKAHKVITLEEFKQSSLSNRPLHRNVFCSKHPENVVKFFCDTCQESVCVECTVIDHRAPEHKHRSLQEVAGEYTEQLKQMMAKLKRKGKETNLRTQEVKQGKEELKQRCLEEKRKVRMKTIESIRKAQEEEKRLIGELDEQYDVRVKEVDIQLDDLEMSRGHITDALSCVETLMEHGSPAQLVSTKEETMRHIMKLIGVETQSLKPEVPVKPRGIYSDNSPEMSQMQKSHDVCVSKCIVDNVPSQVVKGDSVNLVITTKDSQGRNVVPYQSVTAKIMTAGGSPKDASVTDNKNGTHTVTFTGQDIGKCQVSVEVGTQPLPESPVSFPIVGKLLQTLGAVGNGKVQFKSLRKTVINRSGDFISADEGNNRVQIINRDGKHKSDVMFSKYAKPFKPKDVAVSADDKVFTTDTGNNQVVVTQKSGKVVRGFDFKEVKNPRCVAVSPLDSSVYVTDWDGEGGKTDKNGHHVVKYTQDGKFVKSFGKHGKGDGEFQGPNFIAVSSQGNAFVSDFNNHRVQVYNENCEFMFSIGQYGNEEGQMKCPTGVDVDPKGNVYVCEQRNNRVQKFDDKGSYICRVDRYEDELNCPQGLTVVSKGDSCNLVVADWGNSCIKIFAV
ncbi:tripartite motif-containing protein 2-like [Glandiceps talaboti]